MRYRIRLTGCLIFEIRRLMGCQTLLMVLTDLRFPWEELKSMRFLLSLAAVVALLVSAEACHCSHRVSKCCSAPCASTCSPCGASACDSGCSSGSCGGASSCGTWETVSRMVMVPTMVTETRTVTVNVPTQEQRQGTRTVCKTVFEPKEETYTVMVPTTEQREGTRTVCNTVAEPKEET